MTTEAVRKQVIQQALADRDSQPAESRETHRIAFQGGTLLLPVIEVPLDLPVLNEQSFRIAPQLADHPDLDQIMADPGGEQSQEVIAHLVRSVHRNTEELAADLVAKGQRDPGVITRSGKLINANTRCVLMRELFQAGEITTNRLRVAVLPTGFGPSDELQLESVLQQQRDWKDEYNFVSELMMLRKLVEGARLTPAAIALQQARGPRGEQKVKSLLEILELMETGRRLLDPLHPIPISSFVTDKSQEENWTGILRKYKQLQGGPTPEAADDLLRGFMVANYLNLGAVHKGGRSIDEHWVSGEFVNALRGHDSDAARALVQHIEQRATEPAPASDVPDGADLLGDIPTTAPSPMGNAVLDLVTMAADDSRTVLSLADGTDLDVADARAVLADSAERAIANSNRGNPAERPGKSMDNALRHLGNARDSLIDVVGTAEFEQVRSDVELAVEEAQIILDELSELLEPRRG